MSITPLFETSFVFQGKNFKTRKPVSLFVSRQVEVSPEHRFRLDSESRYLLPSGSYLSFYDKRLGYRPEHIQLKRPLVISRDLEQGKDQWPFSLGQLAGNVKRGYQVSRFLTRMRFDSIVIEWRRKPFCIIMLSGFDSKTEEEEEYRELAGTKLERYFPKIMVKNLGIRRVLSEKGKQIFGAKIPPEEITALLGTRALKGVSYKTQFSPRGVTIRAEAPGVETMVRDIFLDSEGKKVISNAGFYLKPGVPKGTGLRVLYSQVLSAIKLGVDRIETGGSKEATEDLEEKKKSVKALDQVIRNLREKERHTRDFVQKKELQDRIHSYTLALNSRKEDVRNLQGKRRSVGYYVWPRLGFDVPLVDVFLHMLDESSPYSKLSPDTLYEFFIKKGILPNRPIEDLSLLDLMEKAKGREWWKKHGGMAQPLTFDLKPGSKSLKVLERYIRQRAAFEGLSEREFLRNPRV